ncbi:Hypothetical_protein [Hexamita inflata]|uniref:Hypothetical_protein n=1 Tax=Hexamita inflata TaxID=28002 RepID=A0AA86NEY1_9EUKA|nr:Hypothetical protein HINF_LOCUS5554 [Hexamita inflata]
MMEYVFLLFILFSLQHEWFTEIHLQQAQATISTQKQQTSILPVYKHNNHLILSIIQKYQQNNYYIYAQQLQDDISCKTACGCLQLQASFSCKMVSIPLQILQEQFDFLQKWEAYFKLRMMSFRIGK